jgi:hypothetical protein
LFHILVSRKAALHIFILFLKMCSLDVPGSLQVLDGRTQTRTGASAGWDWNCSEYGINRNNGRKLLTTWVAASRLCTVAGISQWKHLFSAGGATRRGRISPTWNLVFSERFARK